MYAKYAKYFISNLFLGHLSVDTLGNIMSPRDSGPETSSRSNHDDLPEWNPPQRGP